MKGYLKRLARGIFRYEEPKVNVDVSFNQIDVPEDSITDLSFEYTSNESVKGVIWSSNERVRLKENMFSGTEGRIEYQVDTSGMHENDTLSGTFEIVSSGGEYQAAYEFRCVFRSLDTSIGSASNMFDFTNLVQKAPEEAESVFRDDRFKDYFIKGDNSLSSLYDLLSMNLNEPEAIEEFLVAAHQKEPLRLSVSTELNHCDGDDGNTSYSLILNRSTWGYTEVSVQAEPSFLKIYSDTITSDKFTGTMSELPYIVSGSELHGGLNYGRIRLNTFNQTLNHEVVAARQNDASNPSYLRHHRNIIMDITRCYLNYRMKRIDSSDWIETTNKLIQRLRGYETDTPYYKLIQAQVMVAMGQAEECGWLLESARSEIDQKDARLYCYYLYVNSLAKKDSSYTSQAAGIIKQYYENGNDDWRILWLLFYIDKDFNHNQSAKLIRIKDAYQAGCKSPVMYFEAVHILNSQPMLLRVLNRFELQVIMYGCHNSIISEPLAKHIAEVIAGERVASLKMIEIMKLIYKDFDTDDNLNILASQMIRNGLFGQECRDIYEKAILRGLRITRLYEYYVKSIDKDKYIRFPKIVLMFFAYDSGLDYADKAYLFADILTNEIDNLEIMDSYRPHIEQFGYEQLKLGNVDDNLLVIYRYIWNERLLDDSTASHMLKLMFTYRVKIYSDNIDYVLVKHKEIQQVERFSVKDGIVFIPMYTEGCSIVFEDKKGHLHKDTINYEKEKVFSDNSLFDQLTAMKVNNTLFDFYRFEAGSGIHQETADILDNVKNLINLGNIEKDTKIKLNSWLINYYNEFFEGNGFSECLKLINRDNLDLSDAVKLIEVCIRQEQYADARSLIDQYGYQKVSTSLLFKFMRHELERLRDKTDESLSFLCYHIFADKKYNEETLEYMSEIFNGTNDQMYEVWKACENFKVDSEKLEERIIAQTLFTGQHNGRMTEVFTSYYSKGGKKLIIDAYIAYHSFLYFVKHKKVNEIVFKAIYNQLEEGRDILDICKLSLLKFWSSKTKDLSQQQLKIAGKLLNELCRDNKCFEFFKQYGDVLPLPYNILDQTIVEYYGNPEAKVLIHFRFSQDENEHAEIMTVCGGVFVKSFTCFYGESLTYYFTEEYGNKVKKSQVYNIVNNTINTEGNNGRFDYINDMLASRELHDIATMRKLMHGYCVQNYVTDQYFKPI